MFDKYSKIRFLDLITDFLKLVIVGALKQNLVHFLLVAEIKYMGTYLGTEANLTVHWVLFCLLFRFLFLCPEFCRSALVPFSGPSRTGF